MTVVLEFAARGLILLSLAWLVAAALRRRSAAMRAGLWTAALAGLLVMPLASLLAPAWPVPIWETTTVRPSAVEDVPTGASHTTVVSAFTPVFNVPRASRISASPITAAAAEVEPAATRVDWSAVMLAAVAGVILVLVARVVFSHRRLVRIVRDAVPAGMEWRTAASDAAASLGLRRPVPVRVSDALNVPAVAGVWSPVLVLPVEAREWTPDVRRAVVLHEVAHIVRRDPLSQLVNQLACALYWFVPLAWHGARRAAALRERACDDIVLGAGVRPAAYADSLIALARSISMPVSPAVVAMAQPSRMRERVEAILNPSLRRGRVTRTAVLSTTLAVGVATAALGVVEPTTVKAAALQSAKGPASDRLCGGKGLDRSSSSTQNDGGNRRWTVRLSGDGCSVDLRAEGQFEFTPDFTDISRISNNGFFRVDVTDRGVRRQLEIESRGGALTRTWRIDGRERPYDADARAWFASFLVELDRRTAIGVDVRMPLLVRQGGVDAVLNETALMPSDYARHRYYEKLPAAATMSSADVGRVLSQAASLTRSDHYLAELVEVYGGPSVPRDAATRSALVGLIDSIESDHYRATSIERVMGAGVPSTADVDVLLGLVRRMSSDHYKAEVLKKILGVENLPAAQQAAIA
jgi:beta-lactamase regulating signal transducer with metallopeptidase domain